MKVQIHIVALDEENGLKKTLEQEIEIPREALRITEMLHGSDPSIRVTQIATDAMLGAQKPFDMRRQSQKQRMQEVVEAGGKIGGPNGGVREDGSVDPMAKALGLDMVRDIGRQERARSGAPRAPVPGFDKRGR